MNRIDIILNPETKYLVQTIDDYRKAVEELINKEFVGRIMLKKFVKYARILEMDDVKLTTEDNAKIIIRIANIPFVPSKSYSRYKVLKNLLLQRKKWVRMYNAIMRDAEPYLIAEAL